MAWALPRAANQFWMLSEPERATAFLQATRNRVSSPAAQTTLDALSATFAMNAGNPSRAMQIADEVLASPSADDTAVGWAAAAAALSSARMGRFAEVDALAERAIAAGHPGLLRFTSGFGQTTALVDGRRAGPGTGAGPAARRLRAAAAAGPRDRRGVGRRCADREGRTRGRGAAVAQRGRRVGSDRLLVGPAGVDAAGPGARPAGRDGRRGKSACPARSLGMD